ncbi:MAG TPA: CARDB domain-containing protein, partial [Anaerolineae bacterium]|nr:CARDB domain-containing protein [Anaerolineae bacterium]
MRGQPVDFLPPRRPDLTIASVTTPATIRAEAYFTATIHVVNQGNKDSGVSGVTVYTDEGVGGPPSCGNAGGWANANIFASLAPGEGVDVALPQIRYMAPGEHLLWAFVDHTCALTETLESNNVFTQTLQIAPPRRPDLVVTSFSAEPSEPAARDLVTYTLVIENQGEKNNTSITWAGIYIDREPSCGDIGDRVVDTAPLAIGESTTVKLKTPFATAGAHQVWAMTNYGCPSTGGAAESDYTNNTAGPLSFQVDPPLLKDLTVLSITPQPAQPNAGEHITYTVRVKNIGTAASSGREPLGLYKDVVPVMCSYQSALGATIPPLGPGAQVDMAIRTMGFDNTEAHEIYAAANYTCSGEELSIDNNSFGPLTITPGARVLPDLVIQNVTIIPEQPAAKQLAKFVITAHNQGTGDVQYPTYVKVYRDNVPTQCGLNDTGVGDPTYEFERLTAGASTTFTMSAAFDPQGTHTAYVVLDYSCLQPEISETNNTRGPITVEVGPAERPDLAVIDMHVVEDTPVVGQAAHFAVTVRNQGLDRVPSGTYAGVYLNRVPAGCGGGVDIGDKVAALPALYIGEEFQFTLAHTFTATQTTAYAFADYGCLVTESNENNNSFGPVNVAAEPTPAPDLVVEKVTASTLTPATWETITLSVTVRNRGNAPSPATAAAIYTNHSPACGDHPFTTRAVPQLAAGQEHTVSAYLYFAAGGQNSAHVFADFQCFTAESAEDNNVYGPLVFNPEPGVAPDLVVTAFSAPSVRVSQPVTYTVRVENQGVAASTTDAIVAIYSLVEPDGCGNAMFDVMAPVTTLSPGDWRDVRIVYNTGFVIPDAYATWAYVDQSCAQAETDESNNKAGPTMVGVTGLAPDLAIVNAAAAPTDISVGQGVTLTVDVANLGDDA